VLRTQRRNGIELLKGVNDLIVAGYASVELVDKQGDLITRAALKDAFKKFMSDPKYRNVQLAHSNIQVGEVISNYTDNQGRLEKRSRRCWNVCCSKIKKRHREGTRSSK